MPNRLFLLAFIVFIACKKDNTSDVDTQQIVDIEINDSIIVENFISKSQEHYSSENAHSNAFDDFLIEAEAMALQNNYQQQLIKIYHLLGTRYRNRSEYNNAFKYHNKALSISEDLNDKNLLAKSNNQLAVVYRRVDENKTALDLHLKALELAKQIKDTFQIGVAYNGIGNVYLNLKRFYIAIEYFEESMKIAKTKGNVLGLAINTNNIGEALKGLNQTDSALVYFFNSLEHNKTIDSKVGQAICFTSIGNAYMRKQDLKKAIKFLYQGLELNKQTKDKINVSVSYSSIGEIYLRLGQLNSAVENLNKGLIIARSIGSKYQIEACTRLLSETYEKLGAYRTSLEQLKVAEAYNDSLINEENLRHMIALSAIHENEKNEAKIALLNQESQLQKNLIAEQKRTILLFFIFSIITIAITFLIFWQGRLKSKLNSITLQQKLLRSQMNPHFIFNALGAIQVYILENDMENSSRFLSDFSKLMRQVLQSSEKEYTPLEDEKNTLSYYLSLQQLRFLNSFDYKIDIDESISATQTFIPPMITQPFVENAIEHGIKTANNKGLVSITFKKEKNNLTILIRDNGIGFINSQANKIGQKKHESMAIQITHKRLEIIERVTREKTHLSITDISDIDPNKTGVVVKIQMPLIKTNTPNKKWFWQNRLNLLTL